MQYSEINGLDEQLIGTMTSNYLVLAMAECDKSLNAPLVYIEQKSTGLKGLAKLNDDATVYVLLGGHPVYDIPSISYEAFNRDYIITLIADEAADGEVYVCMDYMNAMEINKL